ncbi:MAG: hypothetical protein R3C03_07475 [Pirellulaceae bacterium]
MSEKPSIWYRILTFPLTLWDGIVDGLSRISAGFERMSGGISDQAEKIADVAHRGESVVDTIGHVLTWPFRMVFNLLSMLQTGESLDGPIGWIGRILYVLFYPLIAVGHFVATFVSTRRGALYWWAIPLVLIITPFLFLGLRALMQSKSEISQRYRQALQTALDERDFERVSLYQEKLEQLGTATERMEFQKATAMIEDGDLAGAATIIESMAPVDKPGSPQSHLWLAENYLSGSISPDGKPDITKAQQHITQLNAIFPESNPRVRFLEMQIAIAHKKFGKAESILRELSETFIPATITQLRVELEGQDTAAAEITAGRLLSLISKTPDFLAKATTVSIEYWFRAAMLVKDQGEADRAIKIWGERFPDDPVYQKFVLAYSINRIESQLGTTWEAEDLVELLQSLGKISQSESSDQIRGMMERLSDSAAFESNKDELFAMLDKLSNTPSVVLEFMGTEAAIDDNISKAISLLRRAVSADANNYIAWNNLAFLLHQHFPNKLDEAMDAANRAVSLRPENVQARETRGMILLERRQWQEAIDDLEFATNGLPNATQIHQALATAHRELGNTTQAQIHERMSQAN